MRRTMMRLLPALLVAATIDAQTTWTVTQPNGVQAAIFGAAPGDLLLLPNTGGFPDYEPFTVNKGLTIRGNGCRIGWAPPGSTSPSANELVVNVPGGQRAHLDGLDLTYGYTAILGNIGMRVVVNGGTVTLQRCNILTRSGNAASVTGGTVVFQSCTIQSYGLSSGGRGLFVQGAHVSLRDCVVSGSDRTYYQLGSHYISWPAQAAVALAGGALHAERTSFLGGSSTQPPISLPPGSGACGIEVSGASSVWLSDGAIYGGSSGTGLLGAAAMCNSSGTAVQLANITLVPGPGGAPSTGPVNPAAPLVRLAVVPALQRGLSSALTFLGAANDLFALGLALDPAPSLHPFVVEPLWLVTNIPITAGLLDPAGGANFVVAVPNAPSLQYRTVWFQAVSGAALPLHAATLAGGLIL